MTLSEAIYIGCNSQDTYTALIIQTADVWVREPSRREAMRILLRHWSEGKTHDAVGGHFTFFPFFRVRDVAS